MKFNFHCRITNIAMAFMLSVMRCRILADGGNTFHLCKYCYFYMPTPEGMLLSLTLLWCLWRMHMDLRNSHVATAWIVFWKLPLTTSLSLKISVNVHDNPFSVFCQIASKVWISLNYPWKVSLNYPWKVKFFSFYTDSFRLNLNLIFIMINALNLIRIMMLD